ncbi:hypothetical protein GF325_16295 [Candidatus Bathyarchaeota archaeon]|nr:hypothetical protein [Candidatus Bathyarchaeota archaeon]
MKILQDTGYALLAPGKIGKGFRDTTTHLSLQGWINRIAYFLVFPTLGISWVFLYAFSGGSSFKLHVIHGIPVDLGFTHMHPIPFMLTFTGLLTLLAWLSPSLVFFFINVAFPVNRAGSIEIPGTRNGKNFNTRVTHLANFLAATMPCFSVYFLLLPIAFWTMTTGATLFWGMRTIPDIVFTISLGTCLAFQFAILTIISKNFFTKGMLPSIISLTIFVVFLGSMFLLLFG